MQFNKQHQEKQSSIMTEPQVTIVVVPRERFSYTQNSLESIYENTSYPFNLVYVDGNSPFKIKRYLQEQAKQRGFQLIRSEYYLSPNQARNIGLRYVDTKYLVFIDNDVLVKPGWLEVLVRCAEETGAWVVGPLCLQGSDFQTVHMAGGTIEFREKQGRRWLVEKRPFMRLPLAKVASQLKQEPSELVEFHCIFVRTKTFERTGLLDEKLMSMAEETDFCLSVIHTGNTIYFEPNSVVSYVPPPPLAWSDLPFFFVRWSDIWCQISVEHFREKWNLTEDTPVLRHYHDFVYNHRLLAFVKPNKLISHVLPSNFDSLVNQKLPTFLKKVMKKVMNWRAASLKPI